MMHSRNLFLISAILAILCMPTASFSQAETKAPEAKDAMTSAIFAGLKFRSIGPALTAGRISSLAVHPSNKRTWYAAVACGGVWKTTNSGTSWTPIFDGQKSFSIGCVAIDPNNPHTVWVGAGENNSQRSVSYGDGVYRSDDGGKNWKAMGLRKSEHIARILVDPRNSDVIYVAAQGPLWAPGGDRGLYKSTDGGRNWSASLYVSENTGVTDVVLDPRNPDLIYAASYQRRRHVWTLINGGPESGIYRSRDGGKSWDTLRSGLPAAHMGRIGLAISPVDPDIVYATIEAAEGKGGFFRSTDRGVTWEKRSDFVSNSAQYYQQLVCDPKDPDRVYNLDTYTMVTDDGGRTFRPLGNRHRHVDDHAMWVDPDDTHHYLIGGDGGIYESFDRGATWRFFENMPITQFYRVEVDNAEPFYNVYGGTQDNYSLGGPSGTLHADGIMNEDWIITNGGDGFKSQIDPVDPDIVYAQSQYGGLVRFDRRSGERVGIQPQPAPGEAPFRWNWDSPLLISPHSNNRLYFCSNIVFRSDDRGGSWRPISPDLSRGIDRNTLPVMGKVWGPDAVAKNASTSFYGNIVAFDEAPLKEGLLYAGTDDGLFHSSRDGGVSWKAVSSFPGIPDRAYVSCVRASQHHERTVYISFDNHKMGDFKPYIMASSDEGATWTSISGNLPDEGAVYTVVEDHKRPDLLFAGTEFGVFFTIDRGAKWVKLTGGLPPSAIRDIVIQKRENDLVLATFGRGFYILDDYSPLRDVTASALNSEALLFTPRDAQMYVQASARSRGAQGETFFTAPNRPFGAVLTYYIKDVPKSLKERRKEAEREAEKKRTSVPYPGIEQLRAEDDEIPAELIFEIRDSEGNSVRRLHSPAVKGMQRIVWDLRHADPTPVRDSKSPNAGAGMFVMPGEYEVAMSMRQDGKERLLAGPVKITAKVLQVATLPASDRRELADFQKRAGEIQRVVLGTQRVAQELKIRLGFIKGALNAAPAASADTRELHYRMERELTDIIRRLDGDPSVQSRNENDPPSIVQRMQRLVYSQWSSTSAPTGTNRDALDFVAREIRDAGARLRALVDTDLAALESRLEAAGAPWTPGRIPELK